MSLFADSRYQWRETYFVLFDHKHRPRAADVKRLLAELGPRIEIHELAESDGGHLDSMTVLSHADAAGMDISYGEGEEVKEQVLQLRQEWRSKQPDAKEKPHIARASMPMLGSRSITSRRSPTCRMKRTTGRSIPGRCSWC